MNLTNSAMMMRVLVVKNQSLNIVIDIRRGRLISICAKMISAISVAFNYSLFWKMNCKFNSNKSKFVKLGALINSARILLDLKNDKYFENV